MATKPKSIQNKPPMWAKIMFFGSLTILLFIGIVVNDKESKPGPETPTAEQKTEELPDYVRNGKLVWQIPVCTNPEDYSEYLHAYARKDMDTMKIYERKYRCWMLKTGVRVSILDWNLIKPTKIRVYSDGDMFDLYTSAQFVKGAD